MKFYIGPVTKNTIDTVIQYSLEYDNEFVFIPSRRQIEYNGGYVNGFTTKDFTEYVKSKNNKIFIERDHGGPGQGTIDDDGFESLKEDCKYLDIIHIDPWKKYPVFEDAVEWTLKLINFCYSLNTDITYEIGTEEGIRPIDSEELDRFVEQVKYNLLPVIFSKIKFLVIQCGTNLLEQSNIGTYDSEKLKRMIEVCKKHNLTAKEHNGDWISSDIVKNKEKAGLTCINIAPEFGEIESSVLITNFKENPEDLERFFKICYESNTWQKWVSPEFNPFTNKEKLIKICGHYNFTNQIFLDIKSKYQNIDNDICRAIKYRLMELMEIYNVRKKCILCDSNQLSTYFDRDFEIPCSFSLFDTEQIAITIPYNIMSCNKCDIVQTKYIGNLSIIYGNNHVDSFGQTKNNMNNEFTYFILDNNQINGIIEIGACNDSLAQLIINNLDTSYTIVEADYKGDINTNITIINSFIENVNLNKLSGNTLILSHIFEHLYEPIKFLDNISESENIKYIYFNHPDFEYYCKNNIHNILNIEHIYYFEKQLLVNLLKKYNFILDKEYNYNNHSMFLKFIKTANIDTESQIINRTSKNDTLNYFKSMHYKISKLNNIMSDKTKNFYIWPASAHTVILFVNGLNHNNICGILDNSPNKIGKILYKYNLKCLSLNELIKNKDDNTYIILGGAGNYLNELAINNTNIIIFNDIL